MCVGVSVWLGWSGIRVAGWNTTGLFMNRPVVLQPAKRIDTSLVCLRIFIVMYFYCYFYVFLLYVYLPSSCQLALFSYPDWGFPCFFLSCKANARVKQTKTGHGPHSSKMFVLFCVFFLLCRSVCKCVLYYCHRVATRPKLTNIICSSSIHVYGGNVGREWVKNLNYMTSEGSCHDFNKVPRVFPGRIGNEKIVRIKGVRTVIWSRELPKKECCNVRLHTGLLISP